MMTLNGKGFSLLEVMIGIAIFMVGMLGVAALQISSMNTIAFSGNLTEALYHGTSKIEELMSLPYDVDPGVGNDVLDDVDGDGTDQDTDDDGYDDDDDNATGNADGSVVDNVANWGLDDMNPGHDSEELGVGRNSNYNIYWNVAVDYPLPNTKTIKVFVTWDVKGDTRVISMETVKEEVK